VLAAKLRFWGRNVQSQGIVFLWDASSMGSNRGEHAIRFAVKDVEKKIQKNDNDIHKNNRKSVT